MITHVIPTVLRSLPRDAKGPNQIAFAHEYVVNENMKYELWNIVELWDCKELYCRPSKQDEDSECP